VKLLVVDCQESQLSQDLAKTLNIPLIKVQIKKFADTELYVDLNNPEQLEGADILLAFQFFKNNLISLHDQFIGLIILTDFLKKLNAKSVSVFIPYLPYSRQDLSYDGKAIGPITLIGDILRTAGIDKVLSCDLHSPEVLSLFGPGLTEIELSPFWTNFLKTRFADEIAKKTLCIVSPDSGGYERACSVAHALNIPVACVSKKRVGPDATEALGLDGDVAGKVVVIVDDIVDTGKTATQACDILKKHGALSVTGVFTHGVFSPGAAAQLINSNFDHIYVSNTIPVYLNFKNDKISVVSCSEFIIEKILENLNHAR
jgi:ribose-phosphate pyrophosphokinase